MKQLPAICFFIICSLFSGYSQTFEQIKSSGKYIYGTGRDINSKRADAGALHALVSQISTTVSAESDYWFQNTHDDFKENFEAYVKSYSNMTLTFATKLEEETEDGYFVVRYMPKTNIQRLFAARADKVKSYAKLAVEAEDEMRIGDALRYYYWALVLLKSHPLCNELTFDCPGKGKMILDTWLPDRINRVFSLLTIVPGNEAKKHEKSVIPLSIKFYDNKVRNLDYSYWTGERWAKITSASDGAGSLEYYKPGRAIPAKARIRIEYKYFTKCALDKDVESVMSTVRLPKFKAAEIELEIKAGGKKEKGTEQDDVVGKNENNPHPAEKAIDLNSMKEIDIIPRLVEINDNMESIEIEHFFTDEGYEIYQRLISYGQAVFLPFSEPLETKYLGNDILVRPVPVKFKFPTNNRDFIEHLCFTLNKEKRICNITFSLSQKAVEGILKHARWPDNVKWELIRFMQNYKTAYALERVDYIESIFADNALIIVGRKVKKAEPIDGMYKTLGNEQYEFVRKSKAQYIESLRSVFLSNEFVNIQFSTSEVKRRDADSQVYGIQIEQNYYSSNYGDHGYLFLMIDMKDTLNPKIYVRSWQPEQNPDGTIIGLNNFKF